MKKMIQRVLSMLLALAMICTLLPAVFAAGSEEDVPVLTPAEPGTPISQEAEDIIEADIWSVIDAFEDENIVETRADPVSVEDYAALSREIEELVLASDTYVEDSLIRNGEDNTFFTWETTEGIVCGYSPEVRYRTRNVDTEDMSGENITTKSYATKGGSPTSTKVYLISPYYNDTQSADSSFTDQYKNEGQSIASGIGGTFTQYGYTAATITNIATAMMNGAVVLFDSHGTTDYDNGNGNYTARANTSYLCLKSGTGITSADMAAVSGTYGTYYHAFNGGSAYCVDGTAIANHMTSNAPSSLLWMAICLGMATNGLNAPMRAKGVEVVYGYSQSVTFTGDYKYEASFWDSMLAGNTVAQAISTMKSRYGKWDPAYSSYSQSQAVANYAAFPIVVSDEDTYPGQGKVDAVQTVYSTYTLFGDEGGGSTTPTDSITISFSCPSGVSASAITTTAGTAFTLPTPSGTPTANAYDYTFAGWVTSAVSDTTTAPTIYEAGASVSAQSSLTLYALYTYTSGGSTYYTTSLQSASTSTPITISFSCPAGVSASAINTTAGTYFTLPTPTGTPTANAYAYTFAGWVTSTVSATTTAPTIYQAGASVYAEESLTLYALYTYTSGGSTYYTTSLQNASGSDSTEIDSGTYVLAANVNGTYYAMSNTFASKISGTAITVTDGYVSEADAEGYAITLTKSGSSYTIYNGTSYLKYSSSTNLGSSTTAYKWTISEGVNGSWRFTSATSGRGLVYRAGTTNQFGGYALSNATATSTEYYDIEILPIKASGSSGDTEESTTVYQITSSSQLGNDTYVFMAEATGSYSENGYYALLTVEDDKYYCLNSVGADFDSVPTSLSVGSSLLWNVTYSNGVLTIRDSAGNYLCDTSTSSSARLQLSTTSCTWTPTFYTDGSVSLKSPNGYYLSLRDEQSTMGSDGNPMFNLTTSLSTGSCYFFLYRKTQTDAACSHSNTSTSTVPATCTTAGSTTVTCDDCGETVSTSTIAATGHNYEYSSTVAPTATEQGYDIYVCANCGAEQYQNYTDATGETYTVTFLVPEGVTAIADVECTELTLPVPQGTPTNAPADYSFLGWVSAAVDNSASKPTTIYDTTSTYTISSDITLYALYTYGGGETTRTFTLYDGTNSIYIGDTVIIVAAAYDYAMGSTQNTNNRAAVAITRSSDGKTITTTDEAVGYFTLGWGVNGNTETSKISFKDSNGYLYAASSSGNYLRSKSTLDANGTWTLNRTTTDNTMNFVAQGTYTRNTMQYNASSKIFACYSSASQSAIQMYVLTDESAANATYTTVFYADTTCQHSNTSTNTVDATCTTAGSITVTCDDCGETISTETIAATGHQNTSTNTVEATCTANGSITVTCDDCGKTISTETIAATGHQNTSTNTVEATCTTAGSITVTCDDCGKTVSSETIAATGHVNTSTTTVEATCTANGSITVTCDDCGKTISTETIAATGHQNTSTNTVEATCTTAGSITVTCDDCGKTVSSETIAATGHVNTSTTTVEATCTTNGSITVTCDDCGKTISTETIAATGHEYNYTNNGSNHVVGCDNGCGYSATESHTYENGSCICGATETVIPSEPTEVSVKISHTVSFDSDLQMNYRIKKSNIESVVPNYVAEGAYLVVEKDRYPMGGGAKTVETVTLYPDLTTDPDRLLFSLPGIQSVEMGSELRAVLHFFDADGNEYVTAVDVYSVLAYAELCFNSYDPAKNGYLFTMLIDCMNYGAAAQVNFDRRADELVNAGLDAYQQYATTELSAELTDVRTYVDNDRSITAVTKMGFNVTFADKTEINAKLTIADGYTKSDITSVKVLNEAGEVVDTLTEFTELDDGRLQVTFTGVKSANMRDMYYFVAYVGDQVASQNVGYSIEAYAKSNITSSDAALAALVRNCIYYGDSAKVYFDSLLG